MRLSLIHLEVFDLINLTASDNAILRDKTNKIWTWFCIPPTHIVGHSLCDKTPEIYENISERRSFGIKSVRSCVEKTR